MEVYDETYEEWRRENDHLYKPSPAVFVAGFLGMAVSGLVVLGVVYVVRLVTK